MHVLSLCQGAFGEGRGLGEGVGSTPLMLGPLHCSSWDAKGELHLLYLCWEVVALRGMGEGSTPPLMLGPLSWRRCRYSTCVEPVLGKLLGKGGGGGGG